MLTVRRYGDPILRRKAGPVSDITPEITKLIADMVETMYHEVGIGVAAPQVGVSLRIIVVDDGESGARALLNPVIAAQGGRAVAEEGCLSIPGIFAPVERAEWADVEALGDDGSVLRFRARGLQARVIQHEIDHLDGFFFIDRLDKAARDRIKRKIKRDGLPDEAPHSAFAL